MQHSFDVQEAVDYGLEEAIMIWNLRFWIIKNKANKKHLYEGRTWTYNSNEAFQKLFPYWKRGAIERNLVRMVEKQIIMKGNFNPTKYDRTVWYAFVDEDKFLSSSLIIAHFSDSGNGNLENEKSKSRNEEIEISKAGNITDIKLDIKTFLSLSKEEKKEKLKNLFKEKEYKSDCEKYFLFRQKQGWKSLSDLEDDMAWWENGFKEKNPDKYIKTATSAKITQVEESPELITIRDSIKGLVCRADEFGYLDYTNFFQYSLIRRDKIGFTVLVETKLALKYQDVFDIINVKIEVK